MYVAVKGGERAIQSAHELLAEMRRGDLEIPELTLEQIQNQMGLAVDRVMNEGSLFDAELAALAIKQAQGDMIEAVFLLRAYRTTLPRHGTSEPIQTQSMRVVRRISAVFKDVPGGQLLGPTYDYTHRLLDFTLAANGELPAEDTTVDSEMSPHEPGADTALDRESMARVLEILERDTLVERPEHTNAPERDLTREPLDYPVDRATRLQALARGDEGYLLALAYSTQRGYGRTHPFAGEIRSGVVSVSMPFDELGYALPVGELLVTECEMVNQFQGSADVPPTFTRGYGLQVGLSERKAMSMALVDRSLRADELDEEIESPAQDEEFVLSHCDNVEAWGFVSHLKLPHYVDFQSELELIRKLRHARESHDAS
jgi:alpha-D-ribose 1-methylphosphonate 5-triphosphate synthase subunit PhnI